MSNSFFAKRNFHFTFSNHSAVAQAYRPVGKGQSERLAQYLDAGLDGLSCFGQMVYLQVSYSANIADIDVFVKNILIDISYAGGVFFNSLIIL